MSTLLKPTTMTWNIHLISYPSCFSTPLSVTADTSSSCTSSMAATHAPPSQKQPTEFQGAECSLPAASVLLFPLWTREISAARRLHSVLDSRMEPAVLVEHRPAPNPHQRPPTPSPRLPSDVGAKNVAHAPTLQNRKAGLS